MVSTTKLPVVLDVCVCVMLVRHCVAASSSRLLCLCTALLLRSVGEVALALDLGAIFEVSVLMQFNAHGAL